LEYLKSKKIKDFRLGKIFKTLIEIFKECKAIYPIWHASFFPFIIFSMRLFFKGGFKPKEIHKFGFFNSRISSQTLTTFCSTGNMQKVQASLNPDSWKDITANKGIFYKYCQAANIRIPKLYCIFFKYSAGCSFTGSILRTETDWATFFSSELPSEFVIKPTTGAYGAGVRIYNRVENGYFESLGDKFSAIKIYKDLQFDPKNESFLVQERLKSHPDIVRLSDSVNLQTARIITFIDKYGSCHILHAFFKLIVGENVVDNFDSGRTGNLVAEISLDTGVLKRAISISQDGSGPILINRHPTTGVLFEGFELPLWDDACSLAKDAAIKFLPKRTIGWDLALTEKGVFILEANGRYDPFSLTHQRMDKILSILMEN